MYVHGIKKNMISISTITDNNLKVEFGKYKCLVKNIQDHYRVVATGYKIGGLTKSTHQALTSSVMSHVKLWHQRYGHLNLNNIISL